MGAVSLTPERWPAPAKLNLFLHVVGRRQDGYHLLQTAFQFLNIADELDFSLRDDRQITRQASYSNVPAESDLVVRAAKLLRKTTNSSFGVDIRIQKRLPMGGGLGGGSSDAATTLVALNSIVGLNLSVDELADIGLKLGADVPVFVRGHAAWAEGVGEELTVISPPQDWYLVVVPACQVATAEIFNSADLTRNTPAITIRDFLEGKVRNDCEPVVRGIYPQIAELLDWLGHRAPSRLTGTGSCVYGQFSTREEAARVRDALPAPWQGFVARGLNRSPLLDRLQQQKKFKV